ncbi:MAG TPA: NAD(P)H-binding protein, partial [Solirubrobacteraceae bacterium]
MTGATGMIGSLLTEALVAQGVEFTVMLRPGGSGDRIAGRPGVTSTEGDFDDPASLRGALEGVDRAFLLTNSTERTEAQQIAFVEAAKAQRVGHIVYLWQLAADQQSPVRFLRYHGAVEAALTNSTVGWTFVRPNLILQAYIPFAPIIAQGALRAPIGNAAVSV